MYFNHFYYASACSCHYILVVGGSISSSPLTIHRYVVPTIPLPVQQQLPYLLTTEDGHWCTQWCQGICCIWLSHCSKHSPHVTCVFLWKSLSVSSFEYGIMASLHHCLPTRHWDALMHSTATSLWVMAGISRFVIPTMLLYHLHHPSKVGPTNKHESMFGSLFMTRDFTSGHNNPLNPWIRYCNLFLTII